MSKLCFGFSFLPSLWFRILNNMFCQFKFNPYSTIAVLFIPLLIILGAFNKGSNFSVEATPSMIINSMRSTEYHAILLAEMIVSSVIVLDYLFENAFSPHQLSFKTQGSLGRFAVLASVLISSIMIFFYAIPESDYIVVQMSFSIRILLMLCSTCNFVYQYGHNIWKSKFLMLAVLLTAVGNLIKLLGTQQEQQQQHQFQ
eukprot:gene8625-17792_t